MLLISDSRRGGQALCRAFPQNAPVVANACRIGKLTVRFWLTTSPNMTRCVTTYENMYNTAGASGTANLAASKSRCANPRGWETAAHKCHPIAPALAVLRSTPFPAIWRLSLFFFFFLFFFSKCITHNDLYGVNLLYCRPESSTIAGIAGSVWLRSFMRFFSSCSSNSKTASIRI